MLRLRRLAQGLFVLNALIWISFGGATMLRMSDTPELRVTMLVVAFLMAGNAVAMLVSAWGVSTGRSLLYWLAVAVVVINIALTFTDQFGLFDLVTLLLDLILLGLLVTMRRRARLG